MFLIRRGLRLDADGFDDCLATRLCELQASERTETTSTLESLLLDYASTECQDPLDKVYALVSLSKLARDNFYISYEMDKLDLLLATIEFSSISENLDSRLTVAFAINLCWQLQITTKDLNPPNGRHWEQYKERRDSLPCKIIKSSLHQIGFVASNVIDASLFHKISELREQCTELEHPSGRLVFRCYGLDAYCVRRRDNGGAEPLTSPIWESFTRQVVSPGDLFAFTWESNDAMNTGNSGVLVGFATARIKPNDIFCQFVGTNVGILLRRSRSGLLEVVGRARLAVIFPKKTEMLSSAYKGH